MTNDGVSRPTDPELEERGGDGGGYLVPSGGPAGEGGRAAGVVRVRGVRHSHRAGAPAVDGIDLDIGVGEIVALVGLPGSGKSTLLRILAGDLRPMEGELDLPPRRSAAGQVMLGYAGPDDPHFESLSGWENAVFFARAGGMRPAEAETAVAELMELLGLEDQAHATVSAYSEEARHVLSLVEALAHRPALTVIDEPFTGLSQHRRESLIHALRVRAAQRGTIVVASKQLALIPELADRILFIHEGRIAARGRVAELLASIGTTTRFEIGLVGARSELDPRFRPGIDVVSDGNPYVVETSRGPAVLGEVLAALAAAGGTVSSVKVREPDLAEAFRRATGAELGT